MNCDEAQRVLLGSAGAVPAAVRDHVAECAACREFTRLCDALMVADLTPAPAPALDQAVLAAAHRRLAHRGWRVLGSPRVLAWAAAAAVMVTVGSAVLAVFGRSGPAQPVAELAAPVLEAEPTWAAAQVELAAIEGGLEAMLVELGATNSAPDVQGSATRGADGWDALTELEFDLYFETQSLQQTDG